MSRGQRIFLIRATLAGAVGLHCSSGRWLASGSFDEADWLWDLRASYGAAMLPLVAFLIPILLALTGIFMWIGTTPENSKDGGPDADSQ